uniref:Uncharacterized protein n=1 Tax=Magallana gigas TaxID=29159 RepID=K1QT43_MAGGI
MEGARGLSRKYRVLHRAIVRVESRCTVSHRVFSRSVAVTENNRSKVNEETPVYEVRKRSGQGGIRLHRNLLRQCNSLPIESMDNDRKSRRPKKPSKQDVPVYDADSSSSDSDGFIEITGIPLNPNATPFTPQQCSRGSDSSDSVVEVRNPTDNPMEPVSISHTSADSFQSAYSSSGLDVGEDSNLHDELVETNTPGNSGTEKQGNQFSCFKISFTKKFLADFHRLSFPPAISRTI